MNVALGLGSPRKPLRVAAVANLKRASPVAQQFMTKIKNGVIIQRDVKNEDRSDYLYENKREVDKIYGYLQRLFAENTEFHR